MDTKTFYKTYAKIVIPLMFQGMITKFVSMVDNLMIGQLGDTAIAAVVMGNKILDILMFTIFGVSAAVSVFIAQYYGAKDHQKQQEVFRVGLLMSVVVLLAAGMVLLVFPKTIMNYFVPDERIQKIVLNYITLLFIGYFPFVISINYSTALKVIGQVKIPLFASICGVVINTMGNYIFIFGHFGLPAMSIQGAAIATVVSRFIEFAILISFTKRHQLAFDTKLLRIFHVSNPLLKEIFMRSFPLMINEILWSFGQATILKTYGLRGNEVLAALAITETTSSIFFAFSHGIAGVTPIFISQLLGAKQFKEAYHNALRMLKSTIVGAIILGIMMFTMSFIIPNIYQVSTVSHEIATRTIQLGAIFFVVYLTNTQCYFILRSGGDMRSTLIVDGLYMWTITIPIISAIAYLTNLPIMPMYIIGQCCDVGKMIVSLTMLCKKKWLKNITA